MERNGLKTCGRETEWGVCGGWLCPDEDGDLRCLTCGQTVVIVSASKQRKLLADIAERRRVREARGELMGPRRPWGSSRLNECKTVAVAVMAQGPWTTKSLAQALNVSIDTARDYSAKAVTQGAAVAEKPPRTRGQAPTVYRLIVAAEEVRL